MFFLPSVPHSFLPSFIPLLLPPTGTFLIPSFSSFAFLASFPFSLYCKGHTATPHGAVSEYFVGSGVLNRWQKRFFRFPFSNSRFPCNSVFSFLFSVVRFQFSASVLRFPVYAFSFSTFHFPLSNLAPLRHREPCKKEQLRVGVRVRGFSVNWPLLRFRGHGKFNTGMKV